MTAERLYKNRKAFSEVSKGGRGGAAQGTGPGAQVLHDQGRRGLERVLRSAELTAAERRDRAGPPGGGSQGGGGQKDR